MTENELDNLLMLNYHPKRKDKVMLSLRDNFINTIITRIVDAKLETEFGDTLAKLAGLNRSHREGHYCFTGFVADMKQVKIAALMLYHDNVELLKV